MSDNKNHLYGQNSEENQKIITDRNILNRYQGFKFGKSGCGRAFHVEAISGSGMSFLSKAELVEALAKAEKK
ncbi:hypothetical protein [Ruminococcus sp.]|uniref:hypothetical protein n=1 Tax=Ruminococcus sp. TaxID=41978 RepID=UPI0025F5384D|nr:hypothetical protein [Ruminococcus sp.]